MAAAAVTPKHKRKQDSDDDSDQEGDFLNGGPPADNKAADLVINQGIWDNVSGHITRAPPGRVRTDNQTVPALCHGH